MFCSSVNMSPDFEVDLVTMQCFSRGMVPAASVLCSLTPCIYNEEKG